MMQIMNRIRAIFRKARVRRVNDNADTQELQVELLKGEVRTAQRIQSYGFSSVPPIGADAVVAQVGASNEHLIALGDVDPSVRPIGRSAGQVSLYTEEGELIKLEAGPTITLQAGTSSIVIEDGQITIIAASIRLLSS